MTEAYFKTSFRGYNPEQVDEFIISLSDKYTENEKDFAEQLRALEAENESLSEKIVLLQKEAQESETAYKTALDEKQRDYDALCAEIGERMVLADKRAEEIIADAEKKASDILWQARRDSESEARSLRYQAEQEAEKIIGETRKKCESISLAAEEFRARQNEMTQSMFETEKRFGDALNKLRADIGNEG